MLLSPSMLLVLHRYSCASFSGVICVSRDNVQYLVFDYLNDYKDIQVVDDEDLPNKIFDFINDNLFPIYKLVVVDRQKLGPYKYDRAELLGLIIPANIGKENILNDALMKFCNNQSTISKSSNEMMIRDY